MLRPHLRIRFELNKLPIHLNRNYPARIRSLLNYALAMSMLYYYESIQTAANNSIDCLKPTGEGVRQPCGHDGFHEKIALICLRGTRPRSPVVESSWPRPIQRGAVGGSSCPGPRLVSCSQRQAVMKRFRRPVVSLFGRWKILFESDYTACSYPRLHGDYTFSVSEE